MWDGDMEQLEEGDWSVENAELMYVLLKITKLETVVWGLRRWLSEEEWYVQTQGSKFPQILKNKIPDMTASAWNLSTVGM